MGENACNYIDTENNLIRSPDTKVLARYDMDQTYPEDRERLSGFTRAHANVIYMFFTTHLASCQFDESQTCSPKRIKKKKNLFPQKTGFPCLDGVLISLAPKYEELPR